MELLATLRIYRDDADVKETSFQSRTGDKEWKIVLTPRGDVKASPEFGHQTMNILAHELGHFVANFSGTPAAKKSGFMWSKPEDNLAAEKEAWRIARVIKPDIGNGIQNDALAAYAEVAKKYRGVPDAVISLLERTK